MKVYPAFIRALSLGGINWESDTFRVMLLNDKYKFDKAHRTRADIKAFEIAGPGYKAGGALMDGRKCNDTVGQQFIVGQCG